MLAQILFRPRGDLVGQFEIKAPMDRGLEFQTDSLPIAGLLAGYVVRTWLQRRIELGDARLKGDALLDRLRQEAQRHPDAPFREYVRAITTDLMSALDGKTSADLTTAITTADTKLSDALKDLVTRRADVRTKLDELHNLVVTKWSLPQIITTVLTSAETLVERGRRQLEIDNVAEAKRITEEARVNLAHKLGTSLADWQAHLSSYLDELSKPEALLPASVVAQLRPAVELVKAYIKGVALVAPIATSAQLLESVQSTHTAHTQARRLMTQLSGWLSAVMTQAVFSLEQANIPDRASLERLSATHDEFVNQLAADVERPAGAVDNLSIELMRLQEAWSEALM